MNKIVQKDLQIYIAQCGGAETFLYFGGKETKQIDIKLFFSPNEYYATLFPSKDDRLIFEKELGGLNSPDYYSKTVKISDGGGDESGLPTIPQYNIEDYIAKYLRDWKIYHFHDTSDTAPVKKTCKLGNRGRLSQQGENLAAFLYGIRESQEYLKIVSTIQRVAPFFHDFVLEPESNNLDTIRLKWKHKGTDAYFDANSLSDGTLRFICLTTLLLQPRLPTMILLDEPELGLHPFALQLLAGMMRSASKETQIIASTQSVTLANEFGWEDIIIVDRKDNASVFRRLKEDDVKNWLEDYRLGDIWEKNLIGGNAEWSE